MEKVIARVLNRKNFSLKATGNSMFPVLRSGDVVGYRKTSFGKCSVNDIILVKKGEKMFTHRVVYKNDEYLITKGDNNSVSDGKIYPRQIIGKVYQIKRNGQVFRPDDINLFQSTLYFLEIVKVKKALLEKKINFVFLKGLPLHLYFEKKHPSRIYADCDLLIDSKDYEKTEKVFTSLKYSKAKTEFTAIHKLLKDKPTEFSFYRKVSDFPIVFDIHLEPVFLMNQLGKLNELYSQRLIDEMTDKFLHIKRKITIQNESFYILNTEYLILYLALHFFHHNYRGIHRLEFLDTVIRTWKWEVRSGKLENEIGRWKVNNFVYPVFLMLIKYFGTPLPRGFLSSITPKDKEDKLRYIKKNVMKTNVFDDEMRVQAGINRFRNIFYLSPNPLPVKLLVFLNPQVVYSILWVIYRRLKSSFSKGLLQGRHSP